MFMLVPVPFWPMIYLQEEPGFTFSVSSNNIVTDCNFSSFLGQNDPVLSACSPMPCAPAPSPAWWWPPLKSHQCVIVFLPCPAEPQTRHSTSDVVLQTENREKRTLLLAMLFIMQPTMRPTRTCNVCKFCKMSL